MLKFNLVGTVQLKTFVEAEYSYHRFCRCILPFFFPCFVHTMYHLWHLVFFPVAELYFYCKTVLLIK
jgi:hypothetical protein